MAGDARELRADGRLVVLPGQGGHIATGAIHKHFENAEIAEAATGRQAVELLASRPFDLILMDMQMPEMTGTKATRYIRTHLQAEKRDVPIIALTASATPEEIGNALVSGMNRHLSKPFKPRELAQVIAETLGLKTGSGKQGLTNLQNDKPKDCFPHRHR